MVWMFVVVGRSCSSISSFDRGCDEGVTCRGVDGVVDAQLGNMSFQHNCRVRSICRMKPERDCEPSRRADAAPRRVFIRIARCRWPSRHSGSRSGGASGSRASSSSSASVSGSACAHTTRPAHDLASRPPHNPAFPQIPPPPRSPEPIVVRCICNADECHARPLRPRYP